MITEKSTFSFEEKNHLLALLKDRFNKNSHRHINLKWEDVELNLSKNQEKLIILNKMELTGGEPDVVAFNETTQEYIFFDCSKESPKGRRSVCYDRLAQLGRKKYPPESNAEEMAKDIGIELLDETQYRYLQQFENVDTKTSSWIKTPNGIRKLGGALFGDFRYGTVFIYHNGADSYYGARGFRGCLRI
jgi:hypothetical protein